MAAVIFGGVVTLNLTSTVTIKLLRFASEKKRERVALPCMACRGKGFYMCKLCNGNAAIAWSPMFDPIAINPCVCPTCEGNRVQRCLNCLGKECDLDMKLQSIIVFEEVKDWISSTRRPQYLLSIGPGKKEQSPNYTRLLHHLHQLTTAAYTFWLAALVALLKHQ
ncbi:hypothetical protein VNO80_22011 [Phaseolus coccineus]|uniref:Uncharacterized protein n=1 Tax=Phaseolus coccineus TaxID=3886 RepID=A0AAN9QUJ0_PHACN